MKKSRLIAIVLLASFMLFGIAYAAWSKSLTISNTVKTAKFDLEFQDNGSYSSSKYVDATATIVPNSNGRSLKIDLKNLYPGATAGVVKTIKNNSSIPININSASIVGSVINNIGDPNNVINDYKLLMHTIILKNGDYIRVATFDPEYLIDNLLDTQLFEQGFILNPGKSCTFTYTVFWDDKKGQSYNQDKYKNKTLSYTFNLGCTQATD